MHFNDIELRIRNFGITVLVAVLGGAAYAVKERLVVNLGGESISLAIVLLVAGLFGWGAFWAMDRHWYHKLLHSAVDHGCAIENAVSQQFPEFGLTNEIGRASPSDLPWGMKRIHSDQKVSIFYGFGALVLIVTTLIVLLAVPPVSEGGESDGSASRVEKSAPIRKTGGQARTESAPETVKREP